MSAAGAPGLLLWYRGAAVVQGWGEGELGRRHGLLKLPVAACSAVFS